ncbi:MAG: M55 family metallopeptidase, partial [Desulfurococcales archaeon]|nr:M55 family metallopeptidase [Desulfurococcales archaeon]
MKFYVSVDAEGMPWVPSRYMMSPGDSLYGELREIMTHITNVVVDELYRQGAVEVVVADSHGAMVNIDPFKLDKRASLLRGYPRPMSM